MNSPEPRSLFRVRALAHRGERRYGTVLLARPVSHVALTALFAAFTCGLVLFFVCFSHTRTVQVRGLLLPDRGLIRIVPPQAGVVLERRVHEGQAVRAGDVLFVLAIERRGPQGTSAEGAIASLLQSRRASLEAEQAQQRRQSTLRAQALRQREAAIVDELARLHEQRELQQRRVELAVAVAERYGRLQASDYVSPASVQERHADLIDQRQRLAELDRARSALLRERTGLQSDATELPLQAAREQQATERQIVALDQDIAENEARRETWVRAPRDGVVTAIAAEAGQSVAAQQSLAAVLPAEARLEAELYAPSRAVGFVRPDMTVRLRFDAFPFQTLGHFVGRVQEVSASALRPDELAPVGIPTQGGAQEPLYRIRVTLDRQSVDARGGPRPLRSGMVVDANIQVERRRLYEWALEPLYALGHRV